jgi:hypothetical protein
MMLKRISLTEVRAHDCLYTFNSSNEADGFMACLADKDLNECEFDFQALSKRKVQMDPEDFEPGT